MAMATLERLPTEILQNIISYVNKEDLLGLRQVSQWISSATSRYFGVAFFHTLEISLKGGGGDWERFMGIANSEEFRHFVTTLLIRPNSRCYNSWINRAYDHVNITEGPIDLTSGPVRLLHDCLVNKLPNCRSFDITDVWRSTNANAPPARFTLGPTDILNILFSFAACPDKPIVVKSLRLDAHRGFSTLWLTRLNLEAPRSAIFRQSWAANLRILELTLDFPNGNNSIHVDGQLHRNRDEVVRFTVGLITAAEGLECLTLGYIQVASDFFHAIARAGQEGRLPRGIRHLTLRSLSAPEKDILELLSPFKTTLESLGFYRVCLRSWNKVFTMVRDEFPCLECFTFHQCLGDPNSIPPQPGVSQGNQSLLWVDSDNRGLHVIAPDQHGGTYELITKTRGHYGGIRYTNNSSQGAVRGMRDALNNMPKLLPLCRQSIYWSSGLSPRFRRSKYDNCLDHGELWH